MDVQHSNLSPERITVLAAHRVFPAERLLQVLHDSGLSLLDEHGAASAPLAIFHVGEEGVVSLTFLGNDRMLQFDYKIGERDSRGNAEWKLIQFLRKSGSVSEVELRMDEQAAHLYFEFEPHKLLRIICAPTHLSELEVAAVVRRILVTPDHLTRLA